MDQATELAARLSSAEANLSAQGTALNGHASTLTEHTQAISTLTDAVEGILDLIEPGIIGAAKGIVSTGVAEGKKVEVYVDGQLRVRMGGDFTTEAKPAPTTRLKMRMQGASNTNNPDNPLVHVMFQVAGDDPQFGKFTPNGNLNFSVIPEVAEKLVVGRAYYVDLTLAAE